MAWPFKGKPGKINIIRDSPDPGTWIRAQVTYRYRILSGILLILGHGSELRLHTGIQYYQVFSWSWDLDQSSGYIQVYNIIRYSPDPGTWIRAQVTYRYTILSGILLILGLESELRLHTGIQYYSRLPMSVLGIYFDWF